MIGVTVDQFQIQQSMGKAVEGEWFLAVNQNTGDTVEILAISKAIMGEPGFREGFLEDASELIGIEHPNLVAVINVLDENGSLFLVQEHVEGQKLADLMNKRGALPPEQVLPVLKGILKGIGICNSEGLVHRFLNPNNIVIGNDGEPRIAGLGHVLPTAIEANMPEKHKAYAAQYWSPERLRNPDTTDIRANVYAAGAVLYEMLMGRPPFYGDYHSVVAGHQSGNLPPMHNIPEDLQQVTTQSLSSQPEGRFQNTVEFYKALDKLNLGKSMPLVPGSMSDSFDLAAATMDSALPSDGNSSVDFSLDLPSENEDDELSLGLPPESGSSDLDNLDFGGGFDASEPEKDDTDDTISDGPKPSGLSSAAHEVKVDADFDFDPNGEAPVSDSDFTFGDAGSGFDFGSADQASNQASDDSPDFGFGEDSPSEPAGNDLGVDLGMGMDAPSNQGFSFEESEAAAANDDFSFGGDESSSSDSDGFSFGGEEPASSGGDDFAFGSDDPADSGGDGFAFGNDEASNSGGDDFGFGSDEPVSGGDDFGFGSDEASSGGGDDFGFGSDEPAGSGSGLDFGSNDAADEGGFDFSASDDNDAAASSDLLGSHDATSTSDNFSFDGPATPDSDAGGGFDLGGDNAAAGDSGFDFGGGGGSQFSFDEPSGQSNDNDSGFDFGDGGGSQFSFNGSENEADGGGSQFSFDEPAQEESVGDGFDLGDGGGSQFNFEGPSETPDSSGDAQFDFGGSDEPESEFNFEGASPEPNQAADAEDGNFNFDEGGGFDFTPDQPESEEGSEFDFGNQDHGDEKPAAGSDNEFDFGAEEDPFAGGDAANDAADEDPFAAFAGEDSAAGGATADETPSQQITTDDGAFSFEANDSMEEHSSSSAGLADSLSAADSQIGEKTDIIQVKRVRKVDTKILVGTIALALIAAVGGFLFWQNHRASQVRDATLSEIRTMIDGEQYNQAIGVIDGHLASGVGSSFEAALLREKDRANSMKEKINQQITSLMKRAEEAEKENNLLTDGQTDAYAAYINILKLDSNRQDASVRALEIRERYHNEAESLLLDGKELQALEIYNKLAKADRADQEARNRARDLSGKLRDERSGSLKEQIDKYYARRDYQSAVPYFNELANIDPGSDYVNRMRSSLGDDLVNAGNEALAKTKFEDANRFFELAIKVDPDRSDARNKLSNLGEEALRFKTENTSDELAKAVTAKKYSTMYELAIELNNLDPGNQMASGALDTVRTEVLRLIGLAEGKRENGLYKEAAELYKEAYLIDQNPESQALWQKYERWTPPAGMAYVPPGEFKMGARRPKSSSPVHDVFVSGYYIDLYEVTNREFKEFVDQNPEWHPRNISPQFHDGNYLSHWVNGKPKRDDIDRPVTFVSWFAAREYANWKGNRLLTEAEWEKAARARSNTKYWWGDYSDAKKAVYQFYPEKKPAEISNTQFPANNFGVYHILGNVHEWVEDSYSTEFYAASDGAQNPVNEARTNQKVYRGGSFTSRGRDLEVYNRFYNDPRLCAEDIGFRTGRTANIE